MYGEDQSIADLINLNIASVWGGEEGEQKAH